MKYRAFVAVLTLLCSACSSSGGLATGALTPLRAASGLAVPQSSTKGFELLFVFENAGQGMSPFGGVLVDTAGNIFGTTEYGGANGCGTLFELAPGNGFYTETILHSFTRALDGCEVYGSPVEDPATGELFVTAPVGGAGQYGTAVEFSASYQELAVYSFEQATGYLPLGRVAKVGSTIYVLASSAGRSNAGALIGLSQLSLQETALYSFTGGADGKFPDGGLVSDAAGSLYGTTSQGGASKYGVVFKYVPNANGGTESVLWNFGGTTGDGQHPVSDPLLIDKKGNIYGTTGSGGTYGLGTVFKLTPHGKAYTETVLHSFGNSFDGAGPWGGVVLVGENLWGTTTQGGSKTCACGTIFSVSTKGKQYRVRQSFDGAVNGSTPYGSLFWDGHALNGTANIGGSSFNGGTIFRFTL